MQTVLNLYHAVPSSVWALLAAAVSVSGLTQALKHYFFGRLSASTLTSLTGLVSFLAAAVQWFAQQVHSNPGVLGSHTLAIFAGSQFAYRYLVSPAYGILLDAQKQRSSVSTATTNTAPVVEASF